MFIFEGMRPDAEAIFSFFACLLPNVEYAIGSELFNNFETIVYLWVWRPIDHLVLSMSDPGCQKNDKAGQDTLWPNFANLQKAPQNLHFVHETQNCVFCLSNICTGFPPGRARLATRQNLGFSEIRAKHSLCRKWQNWGKPPQKLSTFHISFNFHHNSCRFKLHQRNYFTSIIRQNFCEHIALKQKCQRSFILLSFFKNYTILLQFLLQQIIQILISGASWSHTYRGPSPEQAYPGLAGGCCESSGRWWERGHVPVKSGDGGPLEQAEGPHAGEGRSWEAHKVSRWTGWLIVISVMGVNITLNGLWFLLLGFLCWRLCWFYDCDITWDCYNVHCVWLESRPIIDTFK